LFRILGNDLLFLLQNFSSQFIFLKSGKDTEHNTNFRLVTKKICCKRSA